MAVSNLQVGLAIAGGLVLAAVVAHGAWTSRKNKPRQADPDRARTDAFEAQDAGPRDPSFDPEELAPSAHDPVDTPMLLPVAERHAPIDGLIDVVVPVAMDDVISGDAVLAVMPSTRRVGSKPLSVEGRSTHSQQWEPPQAGGRYSALQFGLQLANRSGALNDIEYSEFVHKVHAMSDALGGTPSFPEMRDEVSRAKELDAFASEHDAQLGMRLRALYAAWSPGYIQQHAARHGFVPGVIPGRMVLPASTPGLPPILVLAFDTQAALAEDLSQTAIRDVSLSLDVAQVSRHEQAFERMREVAQSLAKAMEGQVTDDVGQPLSDAAMDQISLDIQDLYNTLDARELSAGSVLARRLFS